MKTGNLPKRRSEMKVYTLHVAGLDVSFNVQARNAHEAVVTGRIILSAASIDSVKPAKVREEQS